MTWRMKGKTKALIGALVATVAAAYGIQGFGPPEEEQRQMHCKCIWYNDVDIVEEGVNKK